MNIVPLHRIAKSLSSDYGEEPIEGVPAFDVVKVSNVNGEGHFQGDFEKRRFREDQIADLLVKEDELLVVKSSGSKANILSGKTAICGPDRAGRIVASNFLLRLEVDKSTVIPRYLWYFLNSSRSKAFVRTIVGTSTYPNLKWSLYSSHPIPLPSVAQQRRIAEVLDRAEVLRAKRLASLDQLGSLRHSIFVDLFGNPSINPKGWRISQLRDLCESVIDCPHATPIYATGSTKYPCIRSSDIQNGELTFADTKYVERSEYEKRIARGRPRVGDVVYCREGARFGNAALITHEMSLCLGQRMMLFRSASKVATGVYLWAFLTSSAAYQQAANLVGGSASPHVNIRDILAFRVPVPPIALQREFAQCVAAVEKLKVAQRASLAELNALFASLQHRAFRGEL